MNERLPSRLFATDRYLIKRHNCNASLEYSLLVRDVLEGTEEMDTSCWGLAFETYLGCQ